MKERQVMILMSILMANLEPEIDKTLKLRFQIYWLLVGKNMLHQQLERRL